LNRRQATPALHISGLPHSALFPQKSIQFSG